MTLWNPFLMSFHFNAYIWALFRRAAVTMSTTLFSLSDVSVQTETDRRSALLVH